MRAVVFAVHTPADLLYGS